MRSAQGIGMEVATEYRMATRENGIVLSARLFRVCRVEAQVSHATYLNESALAIIYDTQKDMLANGATRHGAKARHVYICFRKTFCCAAMGTLSLPADREERSV
jgi:hypothetical protein